MNEREEMRRIIMLAKFLAVLMIVLIIIEFVSCAREAKGATITGEKPLGGASLMMQLVYEKEHGFIDIDDLELLFSNERGSHGNLQEHTTYVLDGHEDRRRFLARRKVYVPIPVYKPTYKHGGML